MSAETVVSLNGLSKSFGRAVAVSDVSLNLGRGEILALLGENGAGKTTLVNMLFGHCVPDAGGIEVMDKAGNLRPLAPGRPQAAIAARIGMVHQHFTLAENLDALDNVMLGCERLFGLGRNRTSAQAKLEAIMDHSGLAVPLKVPVGRLAVGQRQRVEILKALYRDVNVLILDEPTATLTPQESDALFHNLGAMARDGLSVIFISHRLREALNFSHRIAVLRHGAKVGEIVPGMANERMIARMMVGDELPRPRREPLAPGAPVLRLEGISAKGRSRRDSVDNLTFSVHKGEILGIVGVSGNGQNTLANVISGMARPTGGEMSVNGAAVSEFHPSAMIGLGVGSIPEDRHREGMVGAMGVAENMVIERLADPNVQSRGMLKRKQIRSIADRLCAEFDIRGPGRNAPARSLSGGNIQKMIIARMFDRPVHLILANQPSRGLDVGAAAQVARRLLEARQVGVGIVLISEDLDEILELADRILVIYDGQLAEAHGHDRESLGLMMAGAAA